MLNVKKLAITASLLAPLLFSASTAYALKCVEGCGPPPGYFTLDLLNVTPTETISDGWVIGLDPPSGTGVTYFSPGYYFQGGITSSAFGGTIYAPQYTDYSFFFIGTYGDPSNNTLALFTNTTFANNVLTNDSTTSFASFFGVDPASLISDLEFEGDGSSLSAFIAAAVADNLAFSVPGPFSILAWDQPSSGGPNGNINPDVTPTPLPSTWTMMLIGLVGFGFFAYRSSRRSSATFRTA